MSNLFQFENIESVLASIKFHAETHQISPDDVATIFNIGLYAYTATGKLDKQQLCMTVVKNVA